MHYIDNLLNRFTMYRVVLYGLLILSGVAFIYSIFDLVYYEPINLLASFLVLGSATFLINKIFSLVLKIPTNFESAIITFLILFLILTPIQDIQSAWVYVLAPLLAIGSKFILKIHKKHIFNPAAIALFVMSFVGLYQVEWWIGNKFIFPIMLVIGLLIVRKIRKFQMFGSFLMVSLLSISAFAYFNKMEVPSILYQSITSWPILFLGTVMLTEPLTTPQKKNYQIIYGGIVGLLFGSQFTLGPLHNSAEFSLVVGNIFSYIFSFKYRIELVLKEKNKIGSDIYEFIFTPKNKFNFVPGQYMEWMLPHKNFDSRGVRRNFSLASSPTEEAVKIGIKFEEEKGSSFKKSLLSLSPGDKITAANLTGDFVLPKKNNKYVFIAGGIGITPFRSIIKHAIDKKEKLDSILFYSSTEEKEFVYENIFKSAEELGLKTHYVCSRPTDNFIGIKGRLTSEIIRQEVPDFKSRIYYLSGPNVMVENYKKLLRSLGIKPNKIVTDYFSGY